MSTEQSQKPKFYEGQYLGADDLTQAVGYSKTQRARHALGGHTWGIAMGLDLEEREHPTDAEYREIFIRPGYAWDGYGRPIVMLAPAKLNPEELTNNQITSEYVSIWLRYHEQETHGPTAGFELCGREIEDQYDRIQETFQIEYIPYGQYSRDSQHDDVTINGVEVDPIAIRSGETRVPDIRQDPLPLVIDESVPFQTFPETGDDKLWLIPIGIVRWDASERKFKQFFADAADPTPTEIELKKQSRSMRRYIGVVAEEINAADGIIRLREREKILTPGESLTNTLLKEKLAIDDTKEGRDLVLKDENLAYTDLVWVEGNLRIEGDAKLFGTKLDFRTSEGNDQAVPLTMTRSDNNNFNDLSANKKGKDLKVTIGTTNTGSNRFTVGPEIENEFPYHVVLDNGYVGILNPEPENSLQIGQGDLAISDNQHRNGKIRLWQETDNASGFVSYAFGTEEWHNTYGGGDNYPNSIGHKFYRGSGELIAQLGFGGTAEPINRLNSYFAGDVGIGTPNPEERLHINGSVRGDQQNGALRIQTLSGYTDIGAKNNGYSHFYTDLPRYYFNREVWINSGVVSSYPQSQDLTFETYGTERMTIKGSSGKVGIGISEPADKLHIKHIGSTRLTIDVDNNGHSGVRVMNSEAEYFSGINTNSDRWVVYDNKTHSERLTINPSGNIGIGTREPNARLTLQQNGGGLRLYSGTNGGHFWLGLYTDGGPGSNRAGWIGYATNGENNLSITNEKSSGRIVLNPATESASRGVVQINGQDINCNDDLWLNYFSKEDVVIGGDLVVYGDKGGYTVDRFINKSGDIIEQGDVVIFGAGSTKRYYGKNDNIPVPEVDLTNTPYDHKVCGIVAEILVEKSHEDMSRAGTEDDAKDRDIKCQHKEQRKRMQVFSEDEILKLDRNKVSNKQVGKMVTLGCYAHCKVDADIAPIEVGDLLTTSTTRGHAQKVLELEKAAGAIIGKALGALKSGKGKIPVYVTTQ